MKASSKNALLFLAGMIILICMADDVTKNTNRLLRGEKRFYLNEIRHETGQLYLFFPIAGMLVYKILTRWDNPEEGIVLATLFCFGAVYKVIRRQRLYAKLRDVNQRIRDANVAIEKRWR